MVSINGKMIPLSSVDDNSCEQMNTKEFEQYEEFQTQIYLGEIRDKRSTDHVKKRPKLEA
jgi:FlaA1/EpsC-like NDP-sugar epimerase